MRILIAPDKFAGTLTAAQAADAIARGWLRRRPDDVVDLCPMSDGGPGFVGALNQALGGELRSVEVPGLAGGMVRADYLLVGSTAYLESAQAVGLDQQAPTERSPMVNSTVGLGLLIRAALDAGSKRIVVGVGGTATNDGGAGLLAALGATATGARLDAGPAGLSGLQAVDLAAPLQALSGVELVVASDVDTQLLGLIGATKTFGPQKGLTEEELLIADAHLQRFAESADRKLATAAGAGAGGGIGYALMLLGGVREPGVALIAETLVLAERAASADLVLTGEGSFDFSSRAGKVPYGVAEVAGAALRPCVVLAGQVLIGSREMRALGIESGYAMTDLVGEERSFAEPAEALADLAERVARTWALGE
ncbi:glycerate kinase [Nocardioides sp. Bht2]|uniref:glycerate kinase family protein n=1 Tax=Nocardioides sp. Bht2 TaxID=3392297 RepID=UPI0039B3B290